VATSDSAYRGRIAPSPTGLLHLGHARTFWIAHARAAARGGQIVLRIDDLDRARCRAEYVSAAIQDLKWLGLSWSEGPDLGGPFEPYTQSLRTDRYRNALRLLHRAGLIFPCTRSRRDVQEAAGAPHEARGEHDEPVYPKQFRPPSDSPLPSLEFPVRVNWRFRVPDGEELSFVDRRLGRQAAVAGSDFGDFLVWRKDDTPAYQLACVVDDAEMRITEVVRGADLVTSTFRQLLLYRSLELAAPAFYHCPLMLDENGVRLAKRHDALSLRALRERGTAPLSLIDAFAKELSSHEA
jgi:glutamyl/glutaminyl-tRNA synthetase